MVLTDTHTHLYYETDPVKLKELMLRCFQVNVSRLFLPNVDVSSIPLVLGLAASEPNNCFAMMGLHPCSVKEDFEEQLAIIIEASKKNKIYAIGEIGIDLYWDKETLPFQEIAFREQIALAKQLDLPIVIHCRDAFDEVYNILVSEKDKKLKGIFHCFTGTSIQAQQIIDLGLYLGIGGVVTYKNAGLDKVLSSIALEHIVLETDSPYLAPMPFRGKTNESSFIVYIAEKISSIKQVSIEEVAAITTENSRKIFNV